ncbi:MAG TPA: GDSL-type esterase/lipase family protein [Solirubrobacteraceae bacterium]|nr:GDSL-type esterase/lipase family protein [Solirubrobacteraceae bacterium]
MDVDRRVLFFGDSIVAGVGDPEGRGWVGRVVEASFAARLPLTAYNLGVRRETSEEVAERWRGEAEPRMRIEARYAVVFAFGVNDTTLEEGRLRVMQNRSTRALGRCLDDAAELGLRALVVGPPPVSDPEQRSRVAALSSAYAQLAAGRGVPFIGVAGDLSANPEYTADLEAGDGAHPGADGYSALARLLLAGGWLSWLKDV